MSIVPETEPILSPISAQSSANLPQETFRALIGWTNEQWSIQARASLISATPEQHLQVVRACKLQAVSRPVFTPLNPITEIEENQLVRTIKERPEYAYVEKETINAGGSCRIAQVNLKEVLAFQPIVRVDHLEAWQPASLTNEQLYELCFPSHRDLSNDEVTITQEESRFTISTLDPNIRVLPLHLIPGASPTIDFQLQYDTASSPLKLQLFSFPLIRVPNDLTVVHYQDRYVLRNGYTRAVNLLSKGLQTVPCILVETNNPALIGLKPDMLGLETILGSHPPRLTDFWDESVTCLMKRPALRQIYQVSMNMIAVPR